jgi:hypothetical protein
MLAKKKNLWVWEKVCRTYRAIKQDESSVRISGIRVLTTDVNQLNPYIPKTIHNPSRGALLEESGLAVGKSHTFLFGWTRWRVAIKSWRHSHVSMFFVELSRRSKDPCSLPSLAVDGTTVSKRMLMEISLSISPLNDFNQWSITCVPLRVWPRTLLPLTLHFLKPKDNRFIRMVKYHRMELGVFP